MLFEMLNNRCEQKVYQVPQQWDLAHSKAAVEDGGDDQDESNNRSNRSYFGFCREEH